MRKVITALVFALALCACARGQTPGGAQTSGGITLKVKTEKQTYSVGENFGFTVSVRNDGAEKFLYGGEMLGNRKRMWSAFRCEVVDEKGREIRIALTWGVAGIAGRLDPFALRLGPGETYALKAAPTDYLFFDYRSAGVNDLAEHLPAGRYRLRCAYGSERRNGMLRTLAVWEGDKFVQLWERHPESTPKTWEGSATSDEYSFRVVRPK
ncbi:MAG TPA: hypothetical protein VJ866_08315 [Pyrinomonadaceae bacterium]|nr:hypothetical protein [Pyrinomonadaceae bacterium]